MSAQYFELDGILALAGDTERDDRLRLGTGITVPDPWLGGILDLGLRLDGLHGDDWQAYGLKFGYSLEPHWLPGTVDVGHSFDVRKLPESVSRNYRNHCPAITGNGVP